MFFNADGRPDPNGRFQLIDGQLKLREDRSLRQGETVAFDISLMDSAPSDGASISGATLTETERDYAVSRAKHKHDMGQAYKPASERIAFSAEQHRAAIAAAEAAKKASAQREQAFASDPENNASARHGAALALRVTRKHLISSAWKARP